MFKAIKWAFRQGQRVTAREILADLARIKPKDDFPFDMRLDPKMNAEERSNLLFQNEVNMRVGNIVRHLESNISIHYLDRDPGDML